MEPPAPSLQATIETWVVTYIKDNGLELPIIVIAIVCFCFYLLGMGSLWVWKRKALIADQAKSLSEAIKIDMDIAVSINNASNQYNDAIDTMNLNLRDLLDAINASNNDKAKSMREELCRHFSVACCRDLKNLLSLREASRNASHNRMAVNEDAIRMLKTTLKYLKVVNLPALLSRIGNPEPFRLDPTSLNPVKHFIYEFNPVWAILTWRKYLRLRGALKEY